MKKINGKYGEAIIFTDLIEESAITQIEKILNSELAKDAHIRIMPDCHSGAGCTIGTTMRINDKVCPNLVGVDIGCSMLYANMGNIDIDYKKLDDFIHNNIPSGLNVYESSENEKEAKAYVDELYCKDHLRNKEHLYNSLGTLGGGNHFIEIDIDDDNNKYLVIHTGSRNLGKQVADYYQELAIKECDGSSNIKEEIKLTIEKLKSENRHKEIESAIKEISNKKVVNEDFDKDLAYLTGKNKDAYLHDMMVCQSFAKRNRLIIAKKIWNYLGVEYIEYKETYHNYIEHKPACDYLNTEGLVNVEESTNDKHIKEETFILRKGAVSARKGEELLIPINMRDGSLICIGKGNEEWNCSAPHGAGRLFSRSKARELFSLDEFKNSMNGIYTTSVSNSTIDESPFAYKPIDSILENIKDTVEVVKIIKPVYNFKAQQ